MGSDGYDTNKDTFKIQIPVGGWIEAVAKAPRRIYHKFTIPHDNPVYTISLDPEPHVRSVDLSSYRHDPDGLNVDNMHICLLYTSPSPRDRQKSRMPSSA